ncbi:alpha/beta fold hydrolase [Methanobrevibacter curvatus]|uniref:Alpha/beta hydrolase family protein n=1 Tax=Methanobrevibacter curvatus TaxID=49547 RepID=A0A166C609_9EURY|nr:alpha/beta hydrolase [Methanobrevibacter curvatus]KZX11517.1 alpha/beta hydrolase family protein [Methanobrevibacter curvatus]
MEKKIYFEEYGDKSNETIIFLHNKLMGSWIFEKQKKFFLNYHTIFLDIPNHSKSNLDWGTEFSIDESTELLKDFIVEHGRNKMAHLVGIDLGGELILNLISIYPDLVLTAIVSGVNLYFSNYNDLIDYANLKDYNEYNNLKGCNDHNGLRDYNDFLKIHKKKKLQKTLDFSKIEYLDKKDSNFLVRGYLAEFGISKRYFFQIKESIKKLSNKDISNISNETFNFTINDKHSFKNLLILFGTKEYPKIFKSAKKIKNHFPNSKVYSVYRAIHLWNLINPKWFNEVVLDFIENKKLDLSNKKYLEKIE